MEICALVESQNPKYIMGGMHMKLNSNFQCPGEGTQTIKPSMGKLWIFSETTFFVNTQNSLILVVQGMFNIIYQTE